MARYYESIGKIDYAPSGWVVLNCSNSIVWYYKWWIEKFTGKKVNIPLHGAHITVVAGKYEQTQKSVNWKKYHECDVSFRYDSVIMTDDIYYWLTIQCPLLTTIRRSLGLSDLPKWEFHLTIGSINY